MLILWRKTGGGLAESVTTPAPDRNGVFVGDVHDDSLHEPGACHELPRGECFVYHEANEIFTRRGGLTLSSNWSSLLPVGTPILLITPKTPPALEQCSII